MFEAVSVDSKQQISFGSSSMVYYILLLSQDVAVSVNTTCKIECCD